MNKLMIKFSFELNNYIKFQLNGAFLFKSAYIIQFLYFQIKWLQTYILSNFCTFKSTDFKHIYYPIFVLSNQLTSNIYIIQFLYFQIDWLQTNLKTAVTVMANPLTDPARSGVTELLINRPVQENTQLTINFVTIFRTNSNTHNGTGLK